mmetsp:Transcript_1657/g.2929  ORF Transcript_1657/g.2929 Transcript_1657/m.2929 type:complete len:220 (-) Transcript_1657:67-726(-)
MLVKTANGETEVQKIVRQVSQQLPNLIAPTGATNTQRMDTAAETLDFVNGFKDGVVRVTGTESLLYYCNGNLSDSTDVWFYNYQQYFVDTATIDENFNADNSATTMLAIVNHIKTSLQWPYFLTYSCYWSLEEIYRPFESSDLPNLFTFEDAEDEMGRMSVVEHIIMNTLFNLGYIVQDVMWLVQVAEGETNYWYRTAFVFGDIYGRFFYRSLVNSPTK